MRASLKKAKDKRKAEGVTPRLTRRVLAREARRGLNREEIASKHGVPYSTVTSYARRWGIDIVRKKNGSSKFNVACQAILDRQMGRSIDYSQIAKTTHVSSLFAMNTINEMRDRGVVI